MLVKGFELRRKININGHVNMERTSADIAFLVKVGESDSNAQAAFVLYNDGVAVYSDVAHGILYTNNEAFAEFLESQCQD